MRRIPFEALDDNLFDIHDGLRRRLCATSGETSELRLEVGSDFPRCRLGGAERRVSARRDEATGVRVEG